jgi:hypothetical protein
MLRAFVDQLFARGRACALIDPNPENVRAVNAYRRAGFVLIEEREIQWGPVALLRQMPGSIPAGGQMTPFERDSSSLRLALPVVSPGVTGAVASRWHSGLSGGALSGACGCD